VSEDGLDRLIAAEQDERRRLALFLHDGPVQHLSGIALMIDAALHSIETGKLDDARTVLDSALERQRSTIRELRDLSFALEPVVLRDWASRRRSGP
jgi:signal transduction histidine kinase